jgi:uncharacterized protein YjbI with pentapeptide repeats
MANEEHVALLKQGIEVWNAWRKENPEILPDLDAADLHGPDLEGAAFARANLHGANLHRAHLRGADLRSVSLVEAELRGTDFHDADLRGADLRLTYPRAANFRGADLRGADLRYIDLRAASMSGADLGDALLEETIFADIDLSEARGLDSCRHFGPSIIDHRTLQRSGPLPLNFLRGVGLPDNLIDYLPTLLNQPIQFYSCFISYSSNDDEFVHRLHADLQNKGIRCWFAPHDLPTGARIRDALDAAVRVRDKLLVILSNHSIGSNWVEEEVEIALEEERNSEGRRNVLFPIRVDDAVRETKLAWARKLWRERSIGDFTGWKDHDAYRKAFDRLLRDLRRDPSAAPTSD